MKTCSTCGIEKELGNFNRASKSKDGRQPRCRECQRAAGRAYREANGDVLREKAREYAKANRGRRANNHRRSRYGVDEERFESMLHEHGGRCAICRKPCGTGTALSVDHDHESGAVRGLLCRKCNAGIGNLGDDPELVERALRYLQGQLVITPEN